MKSPVASHKTLERVELEDGLVAFRCPETGGHWIPLEHYWRWQKTLPQDGSITEDADIEVPVSEFDDKVKLCPESGTIMTRYRVGHGLAFRVDRSQTGGVWLDAGEWNALHKDGLHRSLHKIFSAPWQNTIRDAEREAAYQDMLEQRLGSDLLERLKTLRNELPTSPEERAVAIAFLQREG